MSVCNQALTKARVATQDGTLDNAAAATAVAAVATIDKAAGKAAIFTCATDGKMAEVFAYYC